MPELRRRVYDVDGLRLHARVADDADGPDIVLVHGISVSSRYMVPVAHELAAWARVHAVDLPGFGQSDKPPRALDVPELAHALRRWLDAARLDRPAFLANSFGCQVVVELAAGNPERASHLILVGPTIDRHARTPADQIARWALTALRDPFPLHLIVLRDTAASGIRRTWRTFRHALRDGVERKLPSIETPTLVVRGERDPLAPERWCEELAALLPQGRLAVVPGAAHALNWSRPRELDGLVRGFLGRRRDADGRTG
jgi:2-hydroxy-6-oxonona-2,4-dienedioate hydrolase